MFGFLKEDQGTVVVANRVFEMFFYNLFISEQALGSLTYQTGETDKKQFVQDGELNHRRVHSPMLCIVTCFIRDKRVI